MSDIRPSNIRAEFSIKTKFSPDKKKKYRYLWEAQISNQAGNGKPVTFVMLNPSKADENSTDPTIDKCLVYAYVLGYTTLRVVNLFAYCTSNSEELPDDYNECVGPCNNSAIRHAVSDAPLIVCAWGDKGQLFNRADEVRKQLKLLDNYRERLYCLGYNGSGEPSHPRSPKNAVIRKNKVTLEPYRL